MGHGNSFCCIFVFQSQTKIFFSILYFNLELVSSMGPLHGYIRKGVKKIDKRGTYIQGIVSQRILPQKTLHNVAVFIL